MKSCQITFSNWNSDRRFYGFIGEVYQHLKPQARIPKILSKVKNFMLGDTSIHMAFELSSDIAHQFKTFATQNGYQCFEKFYNNSIGAFSFIILATPNVTIDSVQSFALTKSGTFYDYSIDPPTQKPGENSADYLSYAAECFGDAYHKSVICVRTPEFDIWACHLGLKNEVKLQQTKKFMDIVNCYSLEKSRPCIIGGDFNSFDNSSGLTFREQIDAVLSYPGIEWLSRDVKNTFVAYPYDIRFRMNAEELNKFDDLFKREIVDEFKQHCEEMARKYELNGGTLDQVFTYGLGDIATLSVVDVGSVSDHSTMMIILNF